MMLGTNFTLIALTSSIPFHVFGHRLGRRNNDVVVRNLYLFQTHLGERDHAVSESKLLSRS